jgi:hypothetical protein
MGIGECAASMGACPRVQCVVHQPVTLEGQTRIDRLVEEEFRRYEMKTSRTIIMFALANDTKIYWNKSTKLIPKITHAAKDGNQDSEQPLFAIRIA